MSIGVLALQGCIDPHIKMIESLGLSALKVRTPQDLDKVERLILPGGESTTMLKLLEKVSLINPIIEFSKNHALWGICAGAILLAKEVSHPKQKSLALIGIHAVRNFYGSQLDSFKAQVDVTRPEMQLDVDFIRAPKLTVLDSEVEVLASHNATPVLVQYKRILCSSFHVELGSNNRLHGYFSEL